MIVEGLISTSQGASETEDVKVVGVFVAFAIVPQTSTGRATTRLPGLGDGVLHRAVVQPASVAPVQAVLPGVVELLEGGHHSILVHAGFLSIVEVQVIAAKPGRVREDDS